MSTVICIHCGEPILTDDNFCAACGKSQTPHRAKPVPAWEARKHEKASPSPVPDGLSAGERRCPHCGMSIAPSAAVCPRCSARLTGSTAPPRPPSPRTPIPPLPAPASPANAFFMPEASGRQLPTVAALVAAIIAAVALPAIHVDGEDFHIGWIMVGMLFDNALIVPALLCVGFGVTAAAATLPMPNSPGEQATAITIGSVLMLALAVRTQWLLSDIKSEADDYGYSLSAGLSSGLILGSLLLIAGAALPWARWYFGENTPAQPVTSSAWNTRPLRPSLLLRPSYGPPGTEVIAKLSGFPSGNAVTVTWERMISGESGVLKTVYPNSEYTTQLSFRIKEDSLAGNMKVRAQSGLDHLAESTFVVAQAPVVANPPERAAPRAALRMPSTPPAKAAPATTAAISAPTTKTKSEMAATPAPPISASQAPAPRPSADPNVFDWSQV